MASINNRIGFLFCSIIISFLLSTVILLVHRQSPVSPCPLETQPTPVHLTVKRQFFKPSEPETPPDIHINETKVNQSSKRSPRKSTLPQKELDLYYVHTNSTECSLKLFNESRGLNVTPLSLVGRIRPPDGPMEISQIFSMFPFVNDGHFIPLTYKPLDKVAILIPYRNRRKHLYTLLPILIPLLMRQNVEFGIFVIELDGPTTFNKGALFNAGFQEIMKKDDYECIILHDVDLLPLDDRNLYRCNRNHPTHFSANIVDFELFYNGLFGGVVGFTPQQFIAINGASNMYFGWGAEDDDLRDRALGRNFTIVRKPYEFAVYKMVTHTKRGYWKENPNRYRIFASRRDRWDYDGLNSLKYKVTRVRNKKILTWINIAINASDIVKIVPKEKRILQSQDFKVDVEEGIINL